PEGRCEMLTAGRVPTATAWGGDRQDCRRRKPTTGRIRVQSRSIPLDITKKIFASAHPCCRKRPPLRVLGGSLNEGTSGMTSMSVALIVGTPKGAAILTSKERETWNMSFDLRGWPVTASARDDKGRAYIAVNSPNYGV